MDVAELRHIFSGRIRKLREGKMNQGEFADSVGISRGAMSYYEQESRTPDIGVLRAICEKYGVSADYMLGLIPDTNHAVSDVCRETALTPDAAKRLNLLARIIAAGEFRSQKEQFDFWDEEFLDMLNASPFTSLPEVLSVLLENDEGFTLLNMLGAIILGAEVDSGGNKIVVRIKSAAKNFEIAYPIENITGALWANIQSDADALRAKLKPESPAAE